MIAFIASLRVGSLLCLHSVLRRQHAEAYWAARRELNVHDAARTLPRNEIEMGRLSANHNAQRHERAVAIGIDNVPTGEGQFEASGHIVHVDFGHTTLRKRPPSAFDEVLCDVVVKARDDQSKAFAAAIGQRYVLGTVGLHEAATVSSFSNIWPSFERLVSM